MTDERMSESLSLDYERSSMDDEVSSQKDSSMDDEVSSQKDSSMDEEVSSQTASFTTTEEDAASLPEEAAQEDDAVYVFRGHCQDKRITVYCCTLSQNGQLAATGGLDNKALLWNAVTGEIIIECTGFSADVTFAAFNYDDKYLAIADLDGIIKVWQIDTKLCVWETKINDIMHVRWHKSSNILLASEETGNLRMFKVPDGNCTVVRYRESIETFVILPDGERAAIGFKSGLIRVVDLTANIMLCSTPRDPSRLHGHQYSVSAIDCHSTMDILISGSVSGQVILSCATTGKFLSLLYDPELPVETGQEDKVTVDAVAFSRNPSLDVAAIALTHNAYTGHGRLFIWNMSNMKFTFRNELGGQRVSSIMWTSTDVLFTAGLDGVLRSYDARAGKCLRVFKGHRKMIFDLYICENEKKALTASADSTARIFDISSVLT